VVAVTAHPFSVTEPAAGGTRQVRRHRSLHLLASPAADRSRLSAGLGRALEGFEHIEQGRLVQSHRVVCPSARTIGMDLVDHHTMAFINMVTYAEKADDLHH
jgi:hypothetical protein